MNVALKEWAIVCDLLLEGHLAILIRKGGIHESAGPGTFELEHNRFALFPSWAHQKPEMIKERWRPRVEMGDEPAQFTIRGIGQATHIWPITNRPALDSLDDLHCWTPAHLDMRFNYKPQSPLFLIAIRAYRIHEPKTITNHAAYSGCRSWIPLRNTDEIDDTDAQVVIDDDSFNHLVKRIENALMK